MRDLYTYELLSMMRMVYCMFECQFDLRFYDQKDVAMQD